MVVSSSGVRARLQRPLDFLVISDHADTNNIGDALMLVYWKDPAFDPKLDAFYYVRVLEIPTPRWTTYDSAFFGVDLPKDVPPTHQEHAYASPIWYSPCAKN